MSRCSASMPSAARSAAVESLSCFAPSRPVAVASLSPMISAILVFFVVWVSSRRSHSRSGASWLSVSVSTSDASIPSAARSADTELRKLAHAGTGVAVVGVDPHDLVDLRALRAVGSLRRQDVDDLRDLLGRSGSAFGRHPRPRASTGRARPCRPALRRSSARRQQRQRQCGSGNGCQQFAWHDLSFREFAPGDGLSRRPMRSKRPLGAKGSGVRLPLRAARAYARR